MYNKEYYLKLKAEHPEKIKEYSKKAYQRGKEKFLESSKELYYRYKIEKPEALKDYAKKSYEKLKLENPEKLKEQHRLAAKRFYEKNKDKLKQKRQDRMEMLKNLETLGNINEKLEVMDCETCQI